MKNISEMAMDKRNLLLADDNAINREMVKKILENFGFNVVTAIDGEDALEKVFEFNRFSLIIMDINMPNLSGIEAAGILKKSLNDDIRSIPIIALTGNDSKNEIQEIFDAGINSYLAKPASPGKLMDVIEKTIENPLYSNADTIKKDKYIGDTPAKSSCGLAEDHIDFETGVSYVGNDPEIFKKLLFRFYTNYKGYIKEVINFIENGDKENSEFTLHSLKGTSAQICAFKLHEHVKNCEKKVKENFQSISQEDILLLDELFTGTMNSISRILQIEKEIE